MSTGHVALPAGIRAALFDMDGVLTDTATLHRQAWKDAFDKTLARVDAKQRPFDDDDYLSYVDGRSRADGIRTFLRSRHIDLPAGNDDDPPGTGSVSAIATLKNDTFLRLLDAQGPHPFEDAFTFLQVLQDLGHPLAVVTASANCKAVLDAAGFSGRGIRFDVIVDGAVAKEQSLAGKPEPDTYAEAARRLGVDASAAAVFDDAVSGAQAGRAGSFGWVVGVDRTTTPAHGKALREGGADVVVERLDDIAVE